jgi:ABC-type sugar transport system permease subunit
VQNLNSASAQAHDVKRAAQRSTVIPGTRLAPWVFISPFFILQAMWTLGPAIYAIWLSVHKDVNGMTGPFNGLANYARAARSFSFGESVGNIWTFVLIVGPIFLFGATLISLLVNSDAGWGKVPARILMYLPFTLPPTAAVIMWAFNFSPDSSVFGPALHLMGIQNATDLGTPTNLPRAIGNIILWQNLGGWIVLLTATLSGIPEEIVEMARIEGAGALALIRYVKLPLIVPTIVLMLISVTTYMATLFTEPTLLSGTLQVDANYTPNMWINNIANNGLFSEAAAAAMLILIVILPFTIAITVYTGFYRLDDRS